MSAKMLQRNYYFAFGSNMNLTQMAERCPGSTFIGKATLRGYKWQINQRHVANIVRVAKDSSNVPADQADVVEGLVFVITDKDRWNLDRKEGIKLGVYERVVLDVFLERHPSLAGCKTAYVRDRLRENSDAVDRPTSHKETGVDSKEKSLEMPKGPDVGEKAADFKTKPSVLSKKPPDLKESPAAEVEEVEAITYLSTKYIVDGLIRQEYVQRMKDAISDAVKLRVSRDFVKLALKPYVDGDVYQPEEEVQGESSRSDPSLSQKHLKEGGKGVSRGPELESAAGERAQRPDQAHLTHHTKKRTHTPKSKKQLLHGEDDGESERIRHRIKEETQVSRKEQDKEPVGLWSSLSSSIFGSSKS